MSLTLNKVSPLVNKSGFISVCREKLNTLGKLTSYRVANTDINTRQFIRSHTPKRLRELAQMNCFAADKIKTELDRRYGQDKYAVIAIGRSLSSIAELMKSMGVDVKILPMSGLRKNSVKDVSKDDLITYKTFLIQNGLSKTDLTNNPDKIYIIMDYTHFGRSLQRAEELLKTDELLGDAKNLISLPVHEVLGNDYRSKHFNVLFSYSRFKDYSYVGKLNVTNLGDVYNQCSPDRIKSFQSNITQGLRKLFWFNVFDSLAENKFKTATPEEEMNAIYRHYLSPQAIKNLIKREQM